jgi:3-methyladenine DNA glycosylase AlkD
MAVPDDQPAATALVAAVRDGLAALADPAKAPGMQAYMKSAMPYRGVQTPALRGLLRQAFAFHPLPDRPAWQRAVLELWEEAQYREERYAAIALTGYRAYERYQDADTLPLYERLIVDGAWWDYYVDEIAIRRIGPIFHADPARIRPLLLTWSEDSDLWKRRTAIICQVGSKAATDVDLLAAVIEPNLDDRRFFIRKAIGWALREYAKTDPDWVRRYVIAAGPRMSGLSRREAVRHLDVTQA